MRIVVGLGNPGKEYQGTRHNIGFELLAELGRRFAAPRAKQKFEAELAEILVGNERVALLAPQTYMNLSGRSVRKAIDFYQLAAADLLVVCDDLNLSVGRLRMRRSGSAGGQKGLLNIIQQLGTPDVPRLRIGIGAAPAGRDAANYVLAKFSKSEQEAMQAAVQTAASAVECWVQDGLDAAMNRYNAVADSRESGDRIE